MTEINRQYLLEPLTWQGVELEPSNYQRMRIDHNIARAALYNFGSYVHQMHVPLDVALDGYEQLDANATALPINSIVTVRQGKVVVPSGKVSDLPGAAESCRIDDVMLTNVRPGVTLGSPTWVSVANTSFEARMKGDGRRLHNSLLDEGSVTWINRRAWVV
jgi:hypothetical protein